MFDDEIYFKRSDLSENKEIIRGYTFEKYSRSEAIVSYVMENGAI